MSTYILENAVTLNFAVHIPATGAVSDADALPTAKIFEADNDTAILTPTVTRRVGAQRTGEYRVDFTASAANGFEAGKSYCCAFIYVISTIAQKQVRDFTIDSKMVGALNDLAQAAILNDATPFAGASVALVKAQTDKLTFSGANVQARAADKGVLNDIPATAIISDGVPFLGARIDGAITSRADAAAWTPGRAAKVDNLDALVSSRAAPADLANLDAAVSSRAVEATVAKEASLAPLALEATVNAVPAAASAAVTAAHGAGSYVDSGAAPTVGAIDAQLSGTHGAASWEGGGASPDISVILSVVNYNKTLVEQIFKRLGLRWGGM